MNVLKTTMLMIFSLCALLCVGYAHSAEPVAANSDRVVYKAERAMPWLPLLSSCSLSVQATDDNKIKFKVSDSYVTFDGMWPSEAGSVSMEASRLGLVDKAVDAGHGPQKPRDQRLVVKFDLVDGEIHPVSYVFEDFSLQHRSKGLAGARRSCPKLKKSH